MHVTRPIIGELYRKERSGVRLGEERWRWRRPSPGAHRRLPLDERASAGWPRRHTVLCKLLTGSRQWSEALGRHEIANSGAFDVVFVARSPAWQFMCGAQWKSSVA